MKHNFLLAAIVFILVLVALSATCHGQVVKIDSVKWVGSWRANITGTDTTGNKCYVLFGMTPKQKRYVRVGNYLLISTGRFARTKITWYKR